MNPEDGTQSVYRSPATIFNASQRMAGIPVTNEHVDIDMPPPINGGKVISSEAIDIVDEENDATVAIKNKLDVSDNMQRIIESKKELSLGYQAELVPHDIYDFEQINIMPHHLAIVPSGRCGSMCSFVDHKPLIENPKEVEEMKIKFKDAKGKVTAKSIIAALTAFTDNKANFTDAKGNVNMQQIIDVITALPEAIKTVPVDQVAKVMPHLEALIFASRQVSTEEEAAEETMVGQEEDAGVTNPDGSEPSMTDEESEEVDVEDTDEDSKEVEVEDADKDAEEKEDEKEDKKDFSDSMAFKDAVAAKAKIFTDKAISAIEKARNFLDDDYVFEGKETAQIMRDALKTATTDTFADAELDIAFKMLKNSGSYKEFGDSKETNKWDDLGEKTF